MVCNAALKYATIHQELKKEEVEKHKVETPPNPKKYWLFWEPKGLGVRGTWGPKEKKS